MSNYRRLISYIYAYEGGVKGKNIGFAKIEVRNGQCRIQVNVKKVFLGGSDIGVYLLCPEKKIQRGRIFIRNGCGEFRANVNAMNVENSGYSMEYCYGLSIFEQDNSWRCYTTIWEDAVIQAAEIQLADVTAEKVKAQSSQALEPHSSISEEIEQELRQEEQKRLDAVPWQEPNENKEKSETDKIEDTPKAETDDNTSAQIEEENPAGNIEEKTAGISEGQDDGKPVEMKSAGESKSGKIWIINDRKPPEPPIPSAEENPTTKDPSGNRPSIESAVQELPAEEAPISQQTEMETLNQESPTKTSPQMPNPTEAFPPKENLTEELPPGEKTITQPPTGELTPEKEEMPMDDKPRPPEPGDPERLKELERLEQVENIHSSIWNRLQRRYPKVLAFDYTNGCEILSIKPQDIGILPRENWIYGNNSFLLHGYYNYRHLILAKLNNPHGEPRYLLGVPGHYFSNEKHMASMFGFPNFVLAKKQPEEDGRFGYWYTDLRL